MAIVASYAATLTIFTTVIHQVIAGEALERQQTACHTCLNP